MNTKKLLSITATILLATTLLCAYMIWRSLENYNIAVHNQEVTHQLVSSIFQRRLLADDYLMNPSTRAKSQWNKEQTAIRSLLEANADGFTSAEEKADVQKITNTLEQSDETFAQVIATFENSENIPTSIVSAQKARYGAQLTVVALNTESAANNLLHINQAQASDLLQRIALLFGIVAVVLFGALIVSFSLIRRSIDRLERREAQDAALLGGIGDGVFAVDGQGNIILFNRAAEMLTGLSQSDVMGKHYADICRFVDEKSGEPKLEFIAKALNGKQQSMPPGTMLRRKDNSLIPVADSAAPVIDKAGSVMGAVVVFRDITKEREVERAKDEFISLASHQLKTPPASLKWSLEVLLDGTTGPINAQQKDVLTTMQVTTQNMIEVIKSLLNVSRLELGTFIVDPKPVDLVALTKAILKEQSQLILNKKLSVRESYPENMPAIPADQGLEKIIIENLLSNAVKYTPAGGSVHVAIKRIGDNVRIEVADSGYGIPKEQQPNIFSKMFRADNVKQIDGTGFGLYLLKVIVDEVAKGKIWFESTEGRGTTFYVEMPLSGMVARKGTSSLS